MPIPLLVAITAAISSAIGGGVGVGIYKSNQHNKAKKNWQDEKQRLQTKIEYCQEQILRKQEKIYDLQHKMKDKDQTIFQITKELHECDRMIDVLEQRQVQLESKLRALWAFLTFRYGQFKVEKINSASQLTQKRWQRDSIDVLIENTGTEISRLSNTIQEYELSLKYFEDEKTEKERMLAEVSEDH